MTLARTDSARQNLKITKASVQAPMKKKTDASANELTLNVATRSPAKTTIPRTSVTMPTTVR